MSDEPNNPKKGGKEEPKIPLDLLYGKKKEGGPNNQHLFWDTQPVPKMEEVVGDEGPYETKTVEEVPKDPYPIASVLEWWVPDINNKDDMAQIYTLLAENYVEDDDSLFRFNYSLEFLQWALGPPGYFHEWHVGVRKKADKKMLAFISGIPIYVRIGDKEERICEINFLCVHKVLREKRLAPILIKEVTRRVNLRNIWQAIYTAGIVLPKPIASAQYFHRSLNPPKLVSIGFSRVPQQYEKFNNPTEMMKRYFALPKAPQLKNLREMKPSDAPQVCELLANYLKKFRVALVMNEAEVAHWITPRPGVVYAYVVENPSTHQITDFVSFYNLPSTVIGNTKYNELRAAYTYYYAATTTSVKTLMNDALIIAKERDFDVFNTLDIMDNKEFIPDLKFGQGDGKLQYYLFNWKFPTVDAQEVGLVML